MTVHSSCSCSTVPRRRRAFDLGRGIVGLDVEMDAAGTLTH